MIDYTLLDQSSVMDYVFYPRDYHSKGPVNSFDLSVNVEDGVSVICRFYKGYSEGPWILFFHGNGEVVSDYDELSSFYTRRRLNLVVADYRGYGLSGGTPTLNGITADSHKILNTVKGELSRLGRTDRLWVMGRSLGSMSALELASAASGAINGIIVESGFISVGRLLEHLSVPVPAGVDLARIYQEALAMVKAVALPILIIHGEYDRIVPYAEGEDLYENIGSAKKELLMIPAADHNDIMFVGLQQYFGAIERFLAETGTLPVR
jgi:uncharacterized protein